MEPRLCLKLPYSQSCVKDISRYMQQKPTCFMSRGHIRGSHEFTFRTVSLYSFAGPAWPPVALTTSFTFCSTEGLVRINGRLLKLLPWAAGMAQTGVPSYRMTTRFLHSCKHAHVSDKLTKVMHVFCLMSILPNEANYITEKNIQ